MDYAFAGAVMALVLFLFGIFAGVGLGDILAKKVVTKGEYVRMNLAILAAAVLVSAVVFLIGVSLFLALIFGVVAGALAGLKFGYGESIGPWGFADKKAGTNKDQVRRVGSKNAEAYRRHRRDGTPEPELISVQDNNANNNAAGKTRGGSSKR